MSEILAPAGGKNSALAAINAGADAIYLGLGRFSARSFAENFDGESFKEICGFSHAFGVKVYAALNTVVKEDELESFIDSVIGAWNDGADAIIVQDLYLGKFIKDKFPAVKLHLSTQAGTCNVQGAVLAKKFGFDRVILARETKFEDIKAIASVIETEAFVQGALCTCFSGQCYLSSFAGGNSGNRGKCKQPCRKLYSIDREGYEGQAYRLSLSDLSVGADIHKLIEAGVTSFKIEGRMRRPEYVSAAVAYYKKLLAGNASAEDFSNLKRTFNRGNYTSGLGFGQDKSLISSAVQGHLGEFVGIVKVENKKYICKSAFSFNKGDGFKILRGGREVGGGTYGGSCKCGFQIFTRDRLTNGDKVFVTTDTALNARLLSFKRLIDIDIKASFYVGKRAEVTINGTTFFSDDVLVKADKRPLTREDFSTCFSKTDSLPFSPVSVEFETDGVFMAVSQLNLLRRKVYAEYYGIISANRNVRVERNFKICQHSAENNDKTAVIAQNLNGLSSDIGILKPSDYSAADALAGNFSGEKFLYVPPFLPASEQETIKRAAKNFDGIYCDGYFGAELSRELNLKFFAGTGLNITNSISLKECKASYICLSKELTLSEADGLSLPNVFYLTAGNIKVMDLIYCPFGKKCKDCDMRRTYTLTDENNRKFTLRRYKISECRFELYNCADLVCGGSAAGGLYDLTLTDGADVYRSIKSGKDMKKIFSNYTRGHSDSRIL